jgi:hypothetical protein
MLVHIKDPDGGSGITSGRWVGDRGLVVDLSLLTSGSYADLTISFEAKVTIPTLTLP